MARGLMSDAEWAFFGPFLGAVRAPQGRPAADHRRVQGGVFWIARTGSAWRDLPEEFELWSSVYRQFRRWVSHGHAIGSRGDGERPGCGRRSWRR